MPDALVALLGPWDWQYNRYDSPDQKKLLGQSYWWSMVSPGMAERAKQIAPTLKLVPVYAHPQLIEGGQRYDLNFFV